MSYLRDEVFFLLFIVVTDDGDEGALVFVYIRLIIV